jgi:hypothetical protein
MLVKVFTSATVTNPEASSSNASEIGWRWTTLKIGVKIIRRTLGSIRWPYILNVLQRPLVRLFNHMIVRLPIGSLRAALVNNVILLKAITQRHYEVSSLHAPTPTLSWIRKTRNKIRSLSPFLSIWREHSWRRNNKN